jgi:glycosyltransferase involved in cell wall biosynthesis
MMHLFVNGLAASAGGGLTYIRSVIPHFAATPDLRVTVALQTGLRKEFRDFTNIAFVELQVSSVRRLWYEQAVLPGLIRSCRADVLLSTGNFALRGSPVPQVLLSRNSLYTSADFYRDLRSRQEYRAWLDTRLKAFLAKRSIGWADATVAPSKAFAEELHRWTGVEVQVIHHGFDQEAFTCDSSPLAAEVEAKLRTAEGSLRLLFVSHYNYYRNFETLIRALPLLRDRLIGRSLKLLLTCKLAAGQNPGAYRPETAARLVRELGVGDMMVELGAIPYSQLHQLYRRADVYVTPAYAETFAHPLVEAMASGLPIVASDLAVHGEICHDAALYFSRFSAEELSGRIVEIVSSPETAARLSALGAARSAAFSWRKHAEELLSLARSLLAAGN